VIAKLVTHSRIFDETSRMMTYPSFLSDVARRVRKGTVKEWFEMPMQNP